VPPAQSPPSRGKREWRPWPVPGVAHQRPGRAARRGTNAGSGSSAVNNHVFVNETKRRAYLLVSSVVIPGEVDALRRTLRARTARSALAAHEKTMNDLTLLTAHQTSDLEHPDAVGSTRRLRAQGLQDCDGPLEPARRFIRRGHHRWRGRDVPVLPRHPRRERLHPRPRPGAAGDGQRNPTTRGNQPCPGWPLRTAPTCC